MILHIRDLLSHYIVVVRVDDHYELHRPWTRYGRLYWSWRSKWHNPDYGPEEVQHWTQESCSTKVKYATRRDAKAVSKQLSDSQEGRE